MVHSIVSYSYLGADSPNSSRLCFRKLTGNDTYRNLTEKSVRQIISLPDPLPGLPGQCIDPSTGESDCSYVVSRNFTLNVIVMSMSFFVVQTWGGGSDSYFEYLVKYPRLTGTSDPIFINTWREAVDSSIETLRKVRNLVLWHYARF